MPSWAGEIKILGPDVGGWRQHEGGVMERGGCEGGVRRLMAEMLVFG